MNIIIKNMKNIQKKFKNVLNDIVYMKPTDIVKNAIENRKNDNCDIDVYNKPKLSMNEFILLKRYDLSKMFVNTLWTKLNSFGTNDMILVDDDMYRMFGYKTTGDKCNDKAKLKRRLIGRSDRQQTLGFIENIDYRIVNLSPPAGGDKFTHGGKRTEENIYITRKTFKKLCLSIKTENSNRIQEYFIIIDDIFIEYMKYEYEYTIRKQQHELVMKDDKIDSLMIELQKRDEIMNKKLDRVIDQNNEQTTLLHHIHEDIAEVSDIVEDLHEHIVQPNDNKALHEEFVLLQHAERLNEYSVIRTQKRNVKKAIERKREQKENHLKEVYNITSHSNPKNLYNRLKEHVKKSQTLKTQFKFTYNDFTCSLSVETITSILTELETETSTKLKTSHLFRHIQ